MADTSQPDWGARQVRRSILIAVILCGAIATTAVVYAWPSRPVSLGHLLLDVQPANSYTIARPTDGDITDGSVVIKSRSSQKITLLTVELLSHRVPSAMQIAQATVLPLHSDLNRSVGIRVGLPSTLPGEAGQRPLRNQRLGSNPRAYDILLGLHIPTGSGPWRATDIIVTYRDGAGTQSQELAQNLMVCDRVEPGCGRAGAAIVDTKIPTPPESCSGSTTFVSGSPTRRWLATDLSSNWVGSGGTISFDQARTASFTTTSSSSVQIGGGATFRFGFLTLQASVNFTFGVNIAHEVSTTQSWTYSLTVPYDTRTGLRATVYVYAWVLPATTVVSNISSGSCHAAYTYGLIYAPDSHTRQYCVTADPWPGTFDLGPNCISRIRGAPSDEPVILHS